MPTELLLEREVASPAVRPELALEREVARPLVRPELPLARVTDRADTGCCPPDSALLNPVEE